MEELNNPLKTILVPIDFSETSFKAWSLGENLARAFKSPLKAAYIHEPPLGAADPVLPAPALSAELKQDYYQHLKSRLGPKADIAVLEGLPYEEIIDMASGGDIGLIIMGGRGQTDRAATPLGSVAERICRFSPVPVLIVHGDWLPIRSILAPVNLAPYSIKGFLWAGRVAATLGARLDALYIGEESSKNSKDQSSFDAAAAALAPLFGGKAPNLLRRSGSPVEEIVSVGKGYDLIVIVAHRKSFLEDITLGMTVERVLKFSNVPVLAIPSEAA